MALYTTVIALTTTPVLVFGPTSTWANSLGGHIQDPVTFNAFNGSAIPIRIQGSSSTAATGTGFILASSATMNAQMLRGDEIWMATTASTASVNVAAWRQVGGSQ